MILRKYDINMGARKIVGVKIKGVKIKGLKFKGTKESEWFCLVKLPLVILRDR